MSERKTEDLPGHWLLARLGKRVLRPGGLELTTWLIKHSPIRGKDVVEFAPGLGKTAALIRAQHPASYEGVDEEPNAVSTICAPAQDTGLGDACADLVIGEAMLTMQGDKGKAAILKEAHRILRSGGTYAIHELALTPDSVAEETKLELRRALARSIRVNARPLTVAEWTELLESHGFEVEASTTADMALLEPRRNLQDEGVRGVATILWNIARDKTARKRVLDIRKVFKDNQDNLAGVALVAKKLPL